MRHIHNMGTKKGYGYFQELEIQTGRDMKKNIFLHMLFAMHVSITYKSH